MKRVTDTLQSNGMDRDISQVEGKIKSMRRDWKSYKGGNAIPVAYKRISPFLEQLEEIFQRERE